MPTQTITDPLLAGVVGDPNFAWVLRVPRSETLAWHLPSDFYFPLGIRRPLLLLTAEMSTEFATIEVRTGYTHTSILSDTR